MYKDNRFYLVQKFKVYEGFTIYDGVIVDRLIV